VGEDQLVSDPGQRLGHRCAGPAAFIKPEAVTVEHEATGPQYRGDPAVGRGEVLG
jgi:hypothetical protein